MKKLYLYLFILLLSHTVVVNAGLRCKMNIISEGDRKYTVSEKLKKCGMLLSKEVLQSADKRRKVEEWFVKINRTCYPLIFNNGVLRTIGDGVRCK